MIFQIVRKFLASGYKKLSTVAQMDKTLKEDANSFFCPRSFDRAQAVMVAVWYDLRLETLETRVRTTAFGKQWSRDYPIDVSATAALPNANLRYQEALDKRKSASSGHVTIRSMSPRHRRSPIPTFATRKLSTVKG